MLDGVSGEWDGGNLPYRSFRRGVSIYCRSSEVLLGVVVSASLYHVSASKYRKVIRQRDRHA
eukprot:scaffold9158_cov59-Phaeocystis_antarctica.AAC.2